MALRSMSRKKRGAVVVYMRREVRIRRERSCRSRNDKRWVTNSGIPKKVSDDMVMVKAGGG